jgi:hypothetical protein
MIRSIVLFTLAMAVASQGHAEIYLAPYKSSYASGETIEIPAAVMEEGTSIEGNKRLIGATTGTLDYEAKSRANVYASGSTPVQFGVANIAFKLPAEAPAGFYTVEVRSGGVLIERTSFRYGVPESVSIPFFRENIKAAADYILTTQNTDGSFDETLGNFEGQHVRTLITAYKYTGNPDYYEAVLNYFTNSNMPNCGNDANSLYGTAALAEFQRDTGNSAFADKLKECATHLADSRNWRHGFWFTHGEKAFNLYLAAEILNNPELSPKLAMAADTYVEQMLEPSAWITAKNTWYYRYFSEAAASGNPLDSMRPATSTALGINRYNGSLASQYLSQVVAAQNLFVPQLYQLGVRGGSSLYSYEISGIFQSGHYAHFTAEPSIAAYKIFEKTGDRDWLLRAYLPAYWLAKNQEANGSFADARDELNKLAPPWVTMWAVWAMSPFPHDVQVVVDPLLNPNHRFEIANAAWGRNTITASTRSPETGYLRITVPEGRQVTGIQMDGVQDNTRIIERPQPNAAVVKVDAGNHTLAATF